MNVIVDYDVGNLDSLLRGLEKAGIKSIVSKDPKVIKSADALVLPGVGAFKEAMISLNASGLVPFIQEHVNKNKPLLGICLGMQLLYENSEEYGYSKGLGFLKGSIKPLKTTVKVPHMGWNELKFNHPNDTVLKFINEGDYVYFVHSFYASCPNEQVLAYAEYGVDVPAIVRQDNIIATQFHPEKSGLVGENIFKALKEILV